jgi:hypothetical protein
LAVVLTSAAVMACYLMENIANRPLYFICLGRNTDFEVKLPRPVFITRVRSWC